MKKARQASESYHYNTGTSADAEMNRVGARSVFMERGYKMKKVTLLLCTLLLVGVGIAGTRQETGQEVENTPPVIEQRPLCVASEMPTAMPQSTTVPIADSAPVEETVVQTSDSLPKIEAAIPATPETKTPLQPAQSPSRASADPYHTDVYPNNVYSEELLYDESGNLIGKTVTIPNAFGPDAVWIDGRAYYDVPGFGLVEWSGPGQRGEAYNMYESGIKVGIMGGDEDAPAKAPTPAEPSDCPEPTGEVIDQTINELPEKRSTPPDYKPNTTPPGSKP